jgi:DNA-binding transcriptional MerR regulator
MTEELYRIGAVSKLTGVTVECLRAWERRYGMNPAEKAGKTRFYSETQIHRLTQIKRLIDQGHPVSQLIKLSDADLANRLGQYSPALTPSNRRLKVALAGTALLLAEKQFNDGNRLEILDRWPSADAFASTPLQRTPPQRPQKLDVVVLEMPSLDIYLIDKYTEYTDARVVVVYHFCTDNDLQIATERGLEVLPWPSTWQQIEETCLRSGRAFRTTSSTQRRFSDEQLFHLATRTSIEGCTCPRDLVQLITQINAYAIHTERCGTVNTAANHFEISLEANEARACLENALSVLVEAEDSVQKAN